MQERKADIRMKTAACNWDEVRRWIDSAREAFERGFSPAPEEKKRILKDRARRLAQEPEAGREGSEFAEVVEFMLAHERYAIESAYVKEIYPMRELTQVPGTPHFVLGIINVRGHIFSVIDIKKFFGLPEKGITELNKAIIIQKDRMEFGILADSITGVRRIPLDEIQPPLPTLTGIRRDYLKGITGDRLVILDAVKLLSDKSIIVHEED